MDVDVYRIWNFEYLFVPEEERLKKYQGGYFFDWFNLQKTEKIWKF